MGQVSGKPQPVESAQVFCNLPHRSIASLWQNFNDYADGFGITRPEFEEICVHLHDDLGCSLVSMRQYAQAFFSTMDSDNNGLVDALELLSTVAAVSGMRLDDILHFLLSSYDFDGQGELAVDEVTLALKSVCLGLCKIFAQDIPKEQLIEVLVSRVFEDVTGKDDDSASLQISVLTAVLCRHPDIISWFNGFSSPVIELPTLESDQLFARDNSGVGVIVDGPVPWTMVDNLAYSSECPWSDIAKQMVPGDYVNTELNSDPPSCSLELTWVFGYESQRSRNNVWYDSHGRIVYPSGKYVISYNTDKNEQRHFGGHEHLVVCVSVSSGGHHVASGDAGMGSKLLVWDASSFEIKFCSLYHRRGVLQTSFSSDGSMVAAVGNVTTSKCLTVHNWKSGDLLYSSLIHSGKCFGVTFLKGESAAVCGEGYIFVWSKSHEGFKKRRGNFSHTCPRQTVTCIVTLAGIDSFATGTLAGELYLWHDRNAVKKVRAHDGMVVALHATQQAVVSGGHDRRVRLWTHRLEPGATFDLLGFGTDASIRSLCLSPDGIRIAVGTKGADIFEISAIDGSDLRGGALASGHVVGHVRGVTACKTRNEACTVGDDGTLRIWDLTTHTLLKIGKFDAELRCVAYTPSGDLLAVGMGNRVNGDGSESFDKCGSYAILNEQDLAMVHEARDALLPLTTAAISGDGETLAMGAEDGAIYLYALLDEYEFIGKCVRHSAAVTAVDFSIDGELLRSNSANGELYFFNADDATNISSIPSLRDIVWESHRVPYAWQSYGAHRTELKDEIVVSTALVSSNQVLCCATSFGYLKLLSYPAAAHDARHVRYQAHAGTISQVVSSGDELMLISVGDFDRCIIQWRVKPSQKQFKGDSQIDVGRYGRQALSRVKMSEAVSELPKIPYVSILNGIALQDEGKAELKDMLPASTSSDSWLGSIAGPSAPVTQRKEVPAMSLCLDHVFGFSCLDMRNCVRYTAEGDAAFIAGSHAVVANIDSNVQRFYCGHEEAITAFALSDDGQVAATGQMGVSSKVLVWDTKRCITLKQLSDDFVNAVAALAFNSSGVLLAAGCFDYCNTITVYDWRFDYRVARIPSGAFRLASLGFDETSTSLVSCSAQEIKFYGISCCSPTFKYPLLGEAEVAGPFLTCLYFAKCAVVGSADGHLHVFKDCVLTSSVKAFAGAIDCMYARSNGDLLATGASDGRVKVWNLGFECVHDLALDLYIKSGNLGVCSVAYSYDETKVLIGTRGGSIVQIPLNTSTVQPPSAVSIIDGHCGRELWGLSAHPTKSMFATTCDDSTLRIYDSLTRRLIRSVKVDAPSRAVAFSPDGRFLVVGYGANKRDSEGRLPFKEGGFVVFQTSDLKKVHEGKDSSEPVRVVRFSPDSRLLAVGSDDAKVRVYTVEDLFSVRTVLVCHKAPIRHVDFTMEGQFIMSADSTHKVCYSESTSGVFIPSSTVLRDEKWSSWSCPVGWPVLGLWMSQPPGCSIVAAQKSSNGGLIACGNSRGQLSVANYPCFGRAGFLSERAHSGAVGDVAWIAGDTHIVTIGSVDHMVKQWRCVYDASRELGDDVAKHTDTDEISKLGGHEYDDKLVPRSSDSFGKVQQWRSSICPPTAEVHELSSQPQIQASFEHIHGMRVADSRHAFRYNVSGDPVYIVGALGVIYLLDQRTQLFYRGHQQPTTCIGINSTGAIAATGDVGDDPELHIWDACTAVPIATFRGIHRCGITCVSFGASSEHLVSLGQDVLHSIVVLRSPSLHWHDGYVTAAVSTSHLKMLWTLFLDDNEYPVCVGGQGGVCYYRFNASGSERTVGVFGKGKIIQPLLCAVAGHSDGHETSFLTGTTSGHIYEWRQGHIVASVTAHDAPVSALTNLGKLGYCSIAAEGVLKFWSIDLKLLYTLNALALAPLPSEMSCYMLVPNLSYSKLSVCMKSGEVYEVTLQTRTSRVLFQNHFAFQLHGLACHPTDSDMYATAGDDGFVIVWSISEKTCLRKVEVDAASRALAWSNDGSKLVVGIGGNPSSTVKDGAYMIIDSSSLHILFEDRKSKKTITDIVWTADVIVMGSGDGKVYVHDGASYDLIRTISLPGASATLPIARVELSSTGEYIRIANSSDEVFDAAAKDGVVASNPLTTKDVEWTEYTCPYNWLTQGVWRPVSEGVNVTATAVCISRGIVAAAYQNGDIRVYRFPCTINTAEYTFVTKLSSLAFRIAFNKSGSYLIAIDAYSRSISLFKIESA